VTNATAYLLIRDGERINVFRAKLVAAMPSGHHHLGVLGERKSQETKGIARLFLVIVDGDLKVAHGAANNEEPDGIGGGGGK
jgi:hypothetical protein